MNHWSNAAEGEARHPDRPRVRSSGWAMWGCRSPSSSPRPASPCAGIDLDLERVSLPQPGRVLPRGRGRRHPRAARRRGHPVRHHQLRGRRLRGRHRDLRADAAPQEQGAGHLVHPLRGGEPAAPAPAGPADGPREHDLPRHHRGGRAAADRVARPRDRRRLLPRLLARAGGSRQQALHHRQHPQGGGRRDARVHRAGGEPSTAT